MNLPRARPAAYPGTAPGSIRVEVWAAPGQAVRGGRQKEEPMSEHSSCTRPDATDMYAVHGVFRDTLGAAPALVGGIAAATPNGWR